MKKEIAVDQIYTIHYFEYTKDFYFPGEAHNFWELLYVDNGLVEVFTDKKHHTLFKGDLIFHQPGEFHRLRANGETAPNLVVVSYSCRSPAAAWFSEKILRIAEQEHTLLAQIIHEAGRAFSSPLDDPLSQGLVRREAAPFGCENMILLYLEEMLVRLIRRGTDISTRDKISSSINQRTKEWAFNRVVNFLENNMSAEFHLDDICGSIGYSRSYLYQVFRERTGHSVMEYYKRVKLEKAKQLIREGKYNFTQICDILGFSSQQYFSKMFKRFTGFTPSEYSSSIKLKSEGWRES